MLFIKVRENVERAISVSGEFGSNESKLGDRFGKVQGRRTIKRLTFM